MLNRSRSGTAAYAALAAGVLLYALLAAVLLSYFVILPVDKDTSIVFEAMAYVKTVQWLYVPVLTVLQLCAFIVLLLAGHEAHRQWRLYRHWVRIVQAKRVPFDAAKLPAPERLAGRRLVVIRSNKLEAFTLGFADPVIVVSTRLLRTFDSDEIEAVLCHEACHCLRRDPLKHFWMAVVERSLGSLPPVGGLIRYARIWGELEADRYAIERTGSRAALGSMLVKWTRSASAGSRPLSGVPFAAGRSIDYRIRQVMEPGAQIRIPVMTWRSALGTSAAALLLVWCAVDFY